MIDWSLIILNLQNHRYTYDRIAKLVGSDWRHIGGLARGEIQQPKFLTGVKLLDLHLDVCPERHERVGDL